MRIKPSTVKTIAIAGAIGWTIVAVINLLIGKHIAAALNAIPAIALIVVARRYARRMSESERS
jgi:hypothetical protein